MFKKYKAEQEVLKNLEISKSTHVKNYFIAIGISLLIVSGLLCVLINLLIFRDYQMIISFGIATSLVIIIWITNSIYYKSIANENSMKYSIIIDSSTISIGIYLCYLIICMMGVF